MFIRKFDFLSRGPQLLINKQQTYKTVSGSIFSSLIIIFVCFYSYSIGKEVFDKQFPLIIERDTVSEEVYYHNLSQSNFFFMYSISTADNLFILDDIEKVLDIRVNHYSYFQNETDSNYTYIPINVTYCNNTKRNPINFFSKDQLDNSFCITNFNINFGGTWDDSMFSSFVVDIFLCKNTTTNESCLPYKDQVEILDNKYFNLYIESNRVNSKEYSNPIVTIMNNIYFSIDINQYKLIEIFYKTVLVQTNIGWLFENIISQYGIQFDYSFLDNTVILNRDDNNKIASLSIYSSRKETIYERKYITILDIISNLGGLLEIIIISFMIISNIISNKLLNIKLINTIFEFNDLSKKVTVSERIEKDRKNNIKPKDYRGNKEEYNSKISIFEKSKNKKIQVNNLLSLSDNKNKRFKLNIIHKNLFLKKHIQLNDCQVISSKIVCPQFRSNYVNYINKLYIKCINEVNSYCSIDYLIQKIREIEYLKFVLLNYEQNISFDYLKKTNIFLDNDNQNFRQYNNKFTENINRISSLSVNQKKNILEKYFKREKLSCVDEKIMNLVEIVY